jgi:hypothetical protein
MKFDFRPVRLDTEPTLITGALALAGAFATAGVLAFATSLLTIILK